VNVQDFYNPVHQKLAAANELSGRAKHAEEQRHRLADSVAALEEQKGHLEQVMTVLATMEAAWRRGFEEALTAMVSRGLTLVLGEPTHFIVESKSRAGVPALEFHLEQGGLETDILEAKGGTVVNLVNFMLRLVVVLAAQPPLRRILVLDEAFAHVSAEYVPELAALLRQLCDETGVQILLITHDPAYVDVADIAYEVTQERGVSQYTRIKSRRSTA
jgi:DNA repair ATPase RecN